MAKFIEELDDKLIEFISYQKIFFVATGLGEGRLNLSPKGLDSLRIVDPKKLIWMNLTGSGNETAAHVKADGRMTIMFCAFEGKPLILRLYGRAKVYHPRDAEFQDYLQAFDEVSGARQFFELHIESVQTSCGFAVPLMTFEGNRSILQDWSKKKGVNGIEEYWEDRNKESIDGLDTGI